MSLVDYPSSEDENADSLSKILVSNVQSSRKKKESVKITVPSLHELRDEESSETQIKKPRLSTGYGLISMLPAPKNSSIKEIYQSLVPHVLGKKKAASDEQLIKPTLSKSQEMHLKAFSASQGLAISSKTQSNSECKDSNDDCDHTSSLTFGLVEQTPSQSVTVCESFTKGTIMPSNLLHSLLTQEHSNKIPSTYSTGVGSSNDPITLESSSTSATVYGQHDFSQPVHEPESIAYPQDPQSSEDSKSNILIDEGFLRLQSKKQRATENLNIIDISGDEQVSSPNSWLNKSLTEEKVQRPSRKKNELPTQQQRRKHQITYLAFQAKEKEIELKNQWAQNRLTRRETQSKYGF